MSASADSTNGIATDLPRHIAIIMDGNGRWARARGKPRTFGHQAGFHVTRDTVETCVERGIEALTLFAFSSENWSRPKQEVGLLMDLLLKGLRSEVDRLAEHGVRLQFIGDRSRFSKRLQDEMLQAEQATATKTRLKLAIAVSYGGRWDIVNATRSVATQVAKGNLEIDAIDEAVMSQHLGLADVPEPDLFIRTGGEKRISNYLLWQLAYTELYFSDVAWPDFDAAELDRAIDFYRGRQRRFGRTGEQIVASSAR